MLSAVKYPQGIDEGGITFRKHVNSSGVNVIIAINILHIMLSAVNAQIYVCLISSVLHADNTRHRALRLRRLVHTRNGSEHVY